MPQVIPGNTNNPTPTQSNNSAQPAPQSSQGWGGDSPWGWNPSASSNTTQDKRLTPQERVEMIEKVFEDILGRKPDTRDTNYYKYSTLSEEEIRKQLITGKEHKQLMQDGRDYKKMKDRAMQAETRIAMLESQIRDQVEEFKQLTELLSEKNRYIQQLRDKLNNPYNLTDTTHQVTTQKYENQLVTSQVFKEPSTSDRKLENSTGIKGAVRNILKNFLKD